MQPNILNDFHYRSNLQKALIIQIRSDYFTCSRLWNIAEKRPLTDDEMNLLEKSFAYLKRSLTALKKLQSGKIQCQIDGGILNIRQWAIRTADFDEI